MYMTYDEVYNLIGNELNAITPEEGWQEARLYIKLVRGSLEYHGDFLGDQGEIGDLNVHDMSGDMYDYIVELFVGMNENRTNLWNRAIFKLASGGKFSIDFNWDEELAQESGAPEWSR